MVKSKKHITPWGEKVSSQQLSEWGSYGGRPRKWTNEAERKRFERQQKKESALRTYRSYGEVKIDRYIVCPQCGKVNHNLSQYFNEKGEYMPETYWFDTTKMEKTNIRENVYHCLSCLHAFSFVRGEIKVEEQRTEIKRAGSSSERSRRWRGKSKKRNFDKN